MDSVDSPSLLFAWELGTGLGHVGPFLPLARRLRAQGVTVHWALTEVGAGARLLEPEGFVWQQAPVARAQSDASASPNYGGLLLRFGYLRFEDLLGMVVAWRQLLMQTKPKLVVADFAPTAVLAARTLGIPVMLFSTGFAVPPRRVPTPSYDPELQVPEVHLFDADQKALASINRVLAYFDRQPLETLWQLYEVEEQGLLCFPELDHYPGRDRAFYWGVLPMSSSGVAPRWPRVNGPRIFAYLSERYRYGSSVLESLKQTPASVLVYAPGLPVQERNRYEAEHLVFAEGPVDLVQAAREARLGINCAGYTTVATFLLAGKPQLLLPIFSEGASTAHRVTKMGAGLAFPLHKPPGDLLRPIHWLLQYPSYAQRAQIFSDRYGAWSVETTVDRLMDRILQLLAMPVPR